MRLASFEDFETEAGLYWPAYHEYPFFAQRAQRLHDRFGGSKVLVAGCGWGYTVQRGLELGMDIWGCDASGYALDRAAEVLPPDAAARVLHADVTRDLADLADRAGGRFTVAVTEDLCPMLTLSEIARARTNLRRVSDLVLHWVTAAPRGQAPHPALQTARAADGWRALLGPDEVEVVG